MLIVGEEQDTFSCATSCHPKVVLVIVTMPSSQIRHGRVPDGRIPNSRVPNNRVPNSRIPNSRVPDSHISSGRISRGRIPSGCMHSSRVLSAFLNGNLLLWENYCTEN
jgi:hypothetical protein